MVGERREGEREREEEELVGVRVGSRGDGAVDVSHPGDVLMIGRSDRIGDVRDGSDELFRIGPCDGGLIGIDHVHVGCLEQLTNVVNVLVGQLAPHGWIVRVVGIGAEPFAGH